MHFIQCGDEGTLLQDNVLSTSALGPESDINEDVLQPVINCENEQVNSGASDGMHNLIYGTYYFLVIVVCMLSYMRNILCR